MKNDLMDKIVSLCKRRGFIFPGSEIYGGLANTWDYGPLGAELKNNLKKHWWKTFVQERGDIVGLDSAILMNPKIWEASGHVGGFSDPLVECKKCHTRGRADKMIENVTGKEFNQFIGEILELFHQELSKNKPGKKVFELSKDGSEIKLETFKSLKCEVKGTVYDLRNSKFIKSNQDETGINKSILTKSLLEQFKQSCNNCGACDWTEPKEFNLMFKTHQGVTEESSSEVYLRPETAQGIFTNFKNVLGTSRKKLPFGIAQIGKSFRNEITPGNFIFRTREFEQMEIEYFVKPGEEKEHLDYWLKEVQDWLAKIGIKKENLRTRAHGKDELSHYSNDTFDIEYSFPWGWGELTGIASRTDFDLTQHEKFSGEDLKYFDDQANEKFIPYVIEPSFGCDRTLLILLLDAYTEEEAPTADGKTETRIVMKFQKDLAPLKAAILPLMKKPELIKVAQEIYEELKSEYMTEIDLTGSIGKRYRRQDEIGTPYCLTVDFDTLEDKSVTIRDRDTMKQDRVKIKDLLGVLKEKFKES
ncbi:MAG TPA: glycine--tRNA ligase [Candidatus Peregrinibacteria bacterium]|nr:glycine--tRNA ligase [Candidatus Peregrinibacteria bacterium]